MKEFSIEIEGTCGMLMHKFSARAEADAVATVKKKKQHVDNRKDEAEEGALRLDDGRLMIPGEYIYQAMVGASGGFQVKGQGKKTYRDAVKGGVLITPEYIPFTDDRKEYDIFSVPVRIQKSRIMRHRPLIPTGWKLRFGLQMLDDSAIPDDVLNAIIASAGQTKALGDYRPRFGRFMVNEFKKT